VLWHFQGAAAGTLLGDAVSVEVRGVDVAAVLLTVVLGAFALAHVLYVGLRERDAELAALRATGWTDRALSRLVLTEGAVLGAVGAVLGPSRRCGHQSANDIPCSSGTGRLVNSSIPDFHQTCSAAYLQRFVQRSRRTRLVHTSVPVGFPTV
jgi:FtsX-like permease family protein